MNRTFKWLGKMTAAFLASVTACAVCGGCSENPNKDKPHPTAVITVKNYGTMELELYQDIAPEYGGQFYFFGKRRLL